ncbi:hypothetical protein [Clostridium tertium]|uniref:hypothetical protein n=1 Tax=Clostridium tertium TaxID=1559 RepID=UPI00356927BA
MLGSATVTLSYKEFNEIVEEKEKLAELINKYKMSYDEFEENKYVKALDKIEQYLCEAKECESIKEMREFIKLSIEEYCKAFNIPKEELEG